MLEYFFPIFFFYNLSSFSLYIDKKIKFFRNKNIIFKAVQAISSDFKQFIKYPYNLHNLHNLNNSYNLHNSNKLHKLHISYITQIIYITHTINLIFKGYKKTNKTFFIDFFSIHKNSK